MGIWKPYQKSQACELTEHARPTNDATPSHWGVVAPTDHHQTHPQCMHHTVNRWWTPILSLRLPLSTIPQLDEAHLNCCLKCYSSGPRSHEPALGFSSLMCEQLCDWICYVGILSNCLQWIGVSSLLLPSVRTLLETCNCFSPFSTIL
jgi:hypothetical protein